MKKKAFNIHKLIGINVFLFFFISLFFGVLTIFRPYVSFWEDSQKHFSKIDIKNIDLDKCVQTVSNNKLIRITLPSKEAKSSNLIRVEGKPEIYLNPKTCKKVEKKEFEISKFFEVIHTGKLLNSLLFKIFFGVISVGVIFLSISGIYLIVRNNYKNTKTKTVKGFYAKYHRLLLLYTLPLIFMFGLSGALFNIGIYSSPILTNYLTNGETKNILKVKNNILFDTNLKVLKPTQEVETKSLNTLYKEAKRQFLDVTFYQMQISNYKDKNEKVKFIGYEPKSFFISSMINESYVVLNGVTGELIDKKMAKDGTFTEKTLDSIFYLHYIRTFSDIPRIVFAFLCLIILFGTLFSLTLWLLRAKEDRFSYKFLKSSSFTIILGSLISASSMFLMAWLIPENYIQFKILNKSFYTQEFVFYLIFLLLFIYIFIKKDIFKVIKQSFTLSSIFLFFAVIFHEVKTKLSIIELYNNSLYEIFYTDLVLLALSLFLFFISNKIPKEYVYYP